MKKIDVCMPIYIGDYLGDTIHLTKSQHGSYLLSIMHYWRKGESLTSEELRAVAGRDIDPVSAFYVWEGNRWHHKRIDGELEDSRKKSETARQKALKGVAARREKGQI
jgi:uncharacterized protein YdaU (DUF1376 family)